MGDVAWCSIQAARARIVQSGATMLTLLDPFEIVSKPPLPAPAPPAPSSPPPAAGDVATSLGEIDERLERDATPFEPELERASEVPPSPDSSGRLRTWCSE
jgi:hypothetical protein